MVKRSPFCTASRIFCTSSRSVSSPCRNLQLRLITSSAEYPVIFKNPSDAYTIGQSGSVGSLTVNVCRTDASAIVNPFDASGAAIPPLSSTVYDTPCGILSGGT
eukprot:30917-Pelagococcus_subviridis.AAC.6